MSKNFEVLLRAERDADLFATRTMESELIQTTPLRVRPQVHIEEPVHKEEIKLIERVFLVQGRQAPGVVVFCGVESVGGAVGICARAGENLADHTGSPVCLVDANPAGSLHEYFGVAQKCELLDSIDGDEPIGDSAQKLPGCQVFLVSAGCRTQADSVWRPEIWLSRLDELRRGFRYVLIAAPPVAHQSKAILLSQGTDGLILVLESQLTHRETARTIKESLAAANVKLLGAVLNNRTFPIPESIYRKL